MKGIIIFVQHILKEEMATSKLMVKIKLCWITCILKPFFACLEKNSRGRVALRKNSGSYLEFTCCMRCNKMCKGAWSANVSVHVELSSSEQNGSLRCPLCTFAHFCAACKTLQHAKQKHSNQEELFESFFFFF